MEVPVVKCASVQQQLIHANRTLNGLKAALKGVHCAQYDCAMLDEHIVDAEIYKIRVDLLKAIELVEARINMLQIIRR